MHVAPRPPVAKPHVEKPYDSTPAIVIGLLMVAVFVAILYFWVI